MTFSLALPNSIYPGRHCPQGGLSPFLRLPLLSFSAGPRAVEGGLGHWDTALAGLLGPAISLTRKTATASYLAQPILLLLPFSTQNKTDYFKT